jgi:3-oxoacyl-[acyl-carrier protein] reductase
VDLGLAGKVAVVTGAASGIGRSCAEILLGEGCKVVATDIQPDGLRVLEDARRQKGELTTLIADAADPEGATAPVRHAAEKYGGLDILIAAAGIFGTARGGMFAGAEGADEIVPKQWDLTQAINLRGPFLAAQAAVPEMAKKGWGRIVVIASVSGQMGGFRAGADYAASKAGLGGVVRSLAQTAGPLGITVNAINPGMIQTPMLSDNVQADLSSIVAERSPLRRLGVTEEVSTMAVILASAVSSFVTGAHLDVNGGFYFA